VANVFTFIVDSNSGGSVDPAEWPGGSQQQTTSTGCSVTVTRPTGNIDNLVGDGFTIFSSNGFSNCSLNGCAVNSCPPAGVGSCSGNRPTCSAALNGTGQGQINASCNQ
jgi:hypothetical protein